MQQTHLLSESCPIWAQTRCAYGRGPGRDGQKGVLHDGVHFTVGL